MKKKSRFLQTPIEPFAVEAGLTADEILARMERISFQGRNLATAHRIWQKMLAGRRHDLSRAWPARCRAGGLRLVVAHLIAHRYVDCLVSTGANLYHDLHETRGQHHYVGSPHADDAALAEDRIDRVYDTYASEEEFCRQRQLDCRFRGDARAAAVHHARVPLPARRPPLEDDRRATAS